MLGIILFLTLFSVSLKMVSAPSTTENIIGLLILMVVTFIMLETKFLTKIKIKKK